MPSSDRHAVLTGWGAHAPAHVVTNADLERLLDTTDEWISTRTGVCERRWADPTTSTGDMAVRAGRAALTRADVAVVHARGTLTARVRTVLDAVDGRLAA
ncbi:hypothetical protein [Cellulomonas oligotrophica]|uniref:3-oxoacyl-[acyl-carrier-protein] synthase III n=1 Tax=Cellulomonas oligotrophica TaxID=931536 RepID=A0A7Y9FCE8_9CELL|nr:hypothetical protein [Cellulomonas oligotrophica]NYD84759.1 3-oxoacyl-[acyl-carrier-protein] synthase III [Cellulomonas oligotrophica]GIG31826.1 hypothetical protein Col01nite_09850 [Cellulomonas oligotrophica]